MAVLLNAASRANSSAAGLCIDEDVTFEVLKLSRILISYLLSSQSNSRSSVIVRLYAQILCKCCYLIMVVCQSVSKTLHKASSSAATAGANASPVGAPTSDSGVLTSLQDAVQLSQITAEAMHFLSVLASASQDHVYASSSSANMNMYYTGGAGGNYPIDNGATAAGASFGFYYASVLYWQSCSELMRLLQQLERRESLHSRAQLQTQPSQQNSSQQWRALNTRVANCLHSAVPPPEALLFELRRVESYRRSSSVFAEDTACARLLLQQQPDIQHGRLHLSGDVGNNCTFRLKFLFTGLGYLCCNTSGGAIHNDKWMVCITELLLSVLDKARNSSSAAVGGSQNNILLSYAPYLAKQLFALVSRNTNPLTTSTNWIFWELAKVKIYSG